MSSDLDKAWENFLEIDQNELESKYFNKGIEEYIDYNQGVDDIEEQSLIKTPTKNY